jgi:hypothetical protein
MKKTPSLFAYVFLFIGLSMLALWTMLIFTKQVPEFETAPFTTITHITAESLTGLMLIIAGYGLLKKQPWAQRFYPLAVGMLLYAVVQASGYYIDHSSPVFVVLFGVMILFSIFVIWDLFKSR